jgi:hypothetical protein
MTEYDEALNEFGDPYYLTYTNRYAVPDRFEAERFLQRYWLPLAEFEAKWREVGSKIFPDDFVGWPSLAFRPEYELIPMVGGSIFSELDFHALQTCLMQLGEAEYVVIQNDFRGRVTNPLRFKFPVSASWDQLMSGNYISTVLFEMFHNEFFVYGGSAIWGKYVANDADIPIDLLGVRSEYVEQFTQAMRSVALKYEERELGAPSDELIRSMPEEYKHSYRIHCLTDSP